MSINNFGGHVCVTRFIDVNIEVGRGGGLPKMTQV
jgi:hypothetical protein